MTFGSIASSANPSSAWSIYDKGTGHKRIEFPFDMDWYHKQSTTKIKSLQHRKERDEDFKHEFLVFTLGDDSICRVERMGDPDARFNALSAQGCTAHDYIQCFEGLPKAKLDESNLVAEIIFPHELDLMHVLRICQAIQSDEKSRNYTLKVYNCYFFALAIQSCLTRLVAGWENMRLNHTWHSNLQTAIESLPDIPDVQTLMPSLLRASFALGPNSGVSLKGLLSQVQFGLEESLDVTLDMDHLGSALNAVLWYSDLKSVPRCLIQEGIKYAMMTVLAEHLSGASPYRGLGYDVEPFRRTCILALLELLSSTNPTTSPPDKAQEPRGSPDPEDHWDYRKFAKTLGKVVYQKFFSKAPQPSGDISHSAQEGSPKHEPNDLPTESDKAVEVPTSRPEGPLLSQKEQAPRPKEQKPDPEEQDLRSGAQIPHSGAQLPNPEGRTLGPQVQTPDPKVQTPGLQVQEPDPQVQTPSPKIQAPSSPSPAGTEQLGTTTVQRVQDFNIREWLWVFWGHLHALFCWIRSLPLILRRRSESSLPIDTQLANMVDNLERTGPSSAAHLKAFCQEVEKLPRSASEDWKERPWSDIQRVIEAKLTSSTLIFKEQKVGLKFWLADKQEPNNGLISEFQNHILARIKLQAEQVDAVGLGSAETIQSELENKLSQVWSLSCDVAGIVTQRARHGCPDLTWKLDSMEGLRSKMVGSSSGKIWEGALLDGTTVAVKRLHQHSSREQLKHMTLVDHGGVDYKHEDWDNIQRENIVQPWGMTILFDRSIAVIWPSTNQGNILDYLKEYPDTDRLKMCIQVASGLAYLHTIPLIHGKLQADSVYVDAIDKIAKIGNFSEARLPGKQGTQSDTGDNRTNPGIRAAPEVPEDRDHRSLGTDIYDLGMTILQIITGEISVWGTEQIEAKKKPPRPKAISSQLWDLLNRCWNDDLKTRPTAFVVLRELNKINTPAGGASHRGSN